MYAIWVWRLVTKETEWELMPVFIVKQRTETSRRFATACQKEQILSGYARGPWPKISAVLMALLACENVEKVWYFGDCSNTYEPFAPERVQEYIAYYMANEVQSLIDSNPVGILKCEQDTPAAQLINES